MRANGSFSRARNLKLSEEKNDSKESHRAAGRRSGRRPDSGGTSFRSFSHQPRQRQQSSWHRGDHRPVPSGRHRPDGILHDRHRSPGGCRGHRRRRRTGGGAGPRGQGNRLG